MFTDNSDNEGENGGDNDNANSSQPENHGTDVPSSPDRKAVG